MASLIGLITQHVAAHPFHVLLEIFLVLTVAYVLMFRQRGHKGKGKKDYPMPSLEEQERRLAAFASRPFRSDSKVTSNVSVPDFKGVHEVIAREGWKMTVTGGCCPEPTECMDLATYDYHSFATHPEITEVARNTVMAYGVGSCGPRGFYGTVKPHLVLEQDLAKFCGTDDAVIYSFGYATVATLISCYCSRGDYIVADEGISAATEEGCVLTRSNMSHYAHNDMADLEAQIKAIVAKEDPKKPKRRFVVTEGVFKNSGSIANLPEILALCLKYKFRLVLEDTYGFGAIGKTGRGTPDHFDIPISKVDIYIGSMSTSLGGVGGFCAGEINMIDFQRLGAAAYVFSASLPPYVTACSSTALALLDKDSSHVEALQRNTKILRSALRAAHFSKNKISLNECVDDASPLVMLRIADACISELGLDTVQNKLQRVINSVEKSRIIMLRHVYTAEETTKNAPSLRVVIKSSIPEEDIKSAATVIINAITEEFA